MKPFVFSLVLVLGLLFIDYARATGPEYFSSRDWIEEKADPSFRNVIYLGDMQAQKGFLVPYRKTLNIQDLVAMTSYKGRLAGITIMRAKNRVEPVFSGVCKPGLRVDFVLQPGDVVWVVDPYAPET